MMEDRFKQTYFEECEDRLLEAEEALNSLQSGSEDPELIDMVFRAVHSIKGGAAAFALEQIVDFTHHFETSLDYMRDGRLDVTRERIDLFLRAKDILDTLIADAKESEKSDPGLGRGILEALAALAATGGEGNDAPAADKTPGQEDLLSSPEGERTWSLVFRPHQDMLKTGNEPLFIIRALKTLGALQLTAETDEIPPFDELPPSQCRMSWRMVLKTMAPEEEIREIFEFVEDMCELKIALQDVPPGDMPERRRSQAVDKQDRPNRRKEDRELKDAMSTGSSSIRVELGRIDNMVNLVGEMVIAQSMLQEKVRRLTGEGGAEVIKSTEQLSRHMHDLQDSVMAVRAQKIKSVFTRMPRIIREASDMLGKDIRLTTFGEDTEVDKTVLENLVDPLTHMVRNAIDHGIETPEDREKIGKPLYGMLQLSARHKSGRIIIEVEDDGKGIDREAVMKKAVEQDLEKPDANLSDNEINNMLFRPGFSTSKEVTEVSGRGVGMDVVKRNITNMGGRISVQSTPGKGSRFSLSLPLTLAVMDGMVVAVGSQRFVLPTINTIESIQPSLDDISTISANCNVIKARGEYVRIMPLFDVFGVTDAITNPEEGLVVLAESDEGDRLAIMVDEVLGQQQVVIKSLETNYESVPGASAATILGDGEVALIIDVPGMIAMEPNIDLKTLVAQNRAKAGAVEIPGSGISEENPARQNAREDELVSQAEKNDG